jgi:HD-like signal output (HDOD) protein
MASAQDLFRIIREEFAAGRLVLPTLPEVAMRIGEIVRTGDADAAKVAAEVAKDPAIASRLLSVANSASVRGAGPAVSTLRLAITRLGFSLTRVLVSQLAMKQLFSARSPVLRRIMHDTWQQSLEVAALSQVLAARVHLYTETAMLGGLMHRVGVLPIAKLLDQHPQLIHDKPTAQEAIDLLHPHVGSLVLKAWKFPDELVSVPRAAFDFAREHDGPADYADVVCVSMLLTAPPDGVDRAAVPAFARVGVSADVESVEMSGMQDGYGRNLELLGGAGRAP